MPISVADTRISVLIVKLSTYSNNEWSCEHADAERAVHDLVERDLRDE